MGDFEPSGQSENLLDIKTENFNSFARTEDFIDILDELSNVVGPTRIGQFTDISVT